MVRLLIVAVVLVLAGCATQAHMPPGATEIQEYVAKNLPRTKAGEMKYSDYYKGYFDKVVSSQVPDRSILLQGLSTLIPAAEAWEAGKIDKAGFESVRRLVIADHAAGRERLMREDEQSRLARFSAASQYMQMQQALQPRPAQIPFTPIPTPVQTNCTRYGNQMNCTSR